MPTFAKAGSLALNAASPSYFSLALAFKLIVVIVIADTGTAVVGLALTLTLAVVMILIVVMLFMVLVGFAMRAFVRLYVAFTTIFTVSSPSKMLPPSGSPVRISVTTSPHSTQRSMPRLHELN